MSISGTRNCNGHQALSVAHSMSPKILAAIAATHANSLCFESFCTPPQVRSRYWSQVCLRSDAISFVCLAPSRPWTHYRCTPAPSFYIEHKLHARRCTSPVKISRLSVIVAKKGCRYFRRVASIAGCSESHVWLRSLGPVVTWLATVRGHGNHSLKLTSNLNAPRGRLFYDIRDQSARLAFKQDGRIRLRKSSRRPDALYSQTQSRIV